MVIQDAIEFLFPIFLSTSILDSWPRVTAKKGLRTFLRKSDWAKCQNDMLEVAISGVGVRALRPDNGHNGCLESPGWPHQPAHTWETPGRYSQGAQVWPADIMGVIINYHNPHITAWHFMGRGSRDGHIGGGAAGVNLECVQCHDSEWSNYLAINPILSFYPSPMASELPGAGFCLIS